uniref:Retrotransposon protein, putative, Ty3-gypsy subclass n=1 Tax=Oryza sativa subsp. japonica TaxID=39947 RepID=Q2R4P7_ORYSJ|nr:retrotransposon protein, putative, Ty3-gypsy subclass [Oryza sativa Japonica Group]
MEYEFHDYFKDVSLMEQRPIDNSSVTYDTISVTPIVKTGIVSNPLLVAPIDSDNKKVLIRPSQAESTKGKNVIFGDPRPETIRINNAKAKDRKVTKDESSSSIKTKKPKLTFEMLMTKFKKGLAGQRFDNQTSDSKRPRSSRGKRFGQTPKQSEPSTIPTPYKPPVVMPWYPYPMSLYGYPFMYYMSWIPMPYYQQCKESPRSVPSHSSNSRQDRFSQKNRSGGSKVKKVKKVWVRKEAKAPEVIIIKKESQDVQDVQKPTGDAVETIQAKKTEADAVIVNDGAEVDTFWLISFSKEEATTSSSHSSKKEVGDVKDKTCNNLEPRTTPKQMWRPKECGIHLAFEIMQSRKPILLGGQDINMLIKKSREMNGRWIQHHIFEQPFVGCQGKMPVLSSGIGKLAYNLFKKSRCLIFKSLGKIGKVIDHGRSDWHCMAGLTGGSLRSDQLCMAGLTMQTGRSDRHCMAGHWFELVASNYFTKWAETVPLKNITYTEAHRIPKHGATKVTPFEFVYGRKAVLPVEGGMCLHPNLALVDEIGENCRVSFAGPVRPQKRKQQRNNGLAKLRLHSHRQLNWGISQTSSPSQLVFN